ncbi:unnamed protein product [Cuscuta epithymum]|uniref:Uncharacterized protein n=1 Tax=Cuscuta epithymum TaxID=186058 RepID=A0AAV0G196_9ASTE|nr:unnamed protein product [Cuscuta epithymum]
MAESEIEAVASSMAVADLEAVASYITAAELEAVAGFIHSGSRAHRRRLCPRRQQSSQERDEMQRILSSQERRMRCSVREAFSVQGVCAQEEKGLWFCYADKVFRSHF